PFSNAVTADPFSGDTGAILKGRPTDPLMIEVNTSTEYWQKGASLVHTDPAGRHDAELPPTARVYLIAGTQHGGRPGTDPSPGPCSNPRNPHSATPALRGSSWRSRNGSEQAPRRRQVAFRRLYKARRLRLKQSRCRQCRGLPFHPERTALGRPSIGSNCRRGLTISTVHGSARSMLMVTRSQASGSRRLLFRSGPILDGTS